MERIATAVRPTHLDTHALSPRTGHHNGHQRIPFHTQNAPTALTAPTTGDIRHQMGEADSQPPRVHLGLAPGTAHGEPRPLVPQQLHRPPHRVVHDPADVHRLPAQPLLPRGDQLLVEYVVEQSGHPRVPGRQPPQQPPRLRPEMAGVIGRHRHQLRTQLLQMSTPGTGHGPRQQPVPPGQLLVPLLQAAQFGPMAFGLGGDLGGVPVREPPVGPAIDEGHDGPDDPLPRTDRRDGHVHHQPVPVPGPQHLPLDPVPAPGAERVGERRLLERDRLAVTTGVQHERVQLPAPERTRPVPHQLRGGRVDQHDPPLGIRADDPFPHGPQHRLGLPPRIGERRLRVQHPGEIPDDEHEPVLTAVLKTHGDDIGGEHPAIGTPPPHPPHRPRHIAPVEVGQQIQQPPPDDPRIAARLEQGEGPGVGTDHRAVAVDEHEAVGQSVDSGGGTTTTWHGRHVHEGTPLRLHEGTPGEGLLHTPRADVRPHTAPGAGSRAEINVAPPPPTGPATDSPLGTP